MVSIFLFAMRQKIESHALLMSAKFSDDRYERIFLQLYGRMCLFAFCDFSSTISQCLLLNLNHIFHCVHIFNSVQISLTKIAELHTAAIL